SVVRAAPTRFPCSCRAIACSPHIGNSADFPAAYIGNVRCSNARPPEWKINSSPSPQNESSKFQAPSSRETSSSKHQRARVRNVGVLLLVVLWMLELGVWSFH